MRKLFFALGLITVCLSSCTVAPVSDEVYKNNGNELISVDRTEVEIPGDQGSDGDSN